MNCPNCNSTVSSDTRFCNKCGGKLTRVCRACLSENMLDTVFCSSCGVKLDEARIVLPKASQEKWVDFFYNFPDFASLMHSNTVAKIIKETQSYNEKHLSTPVNRSFISFPILAKKWGIKSIQYGKKRIDYGLFYFGDNGIVIVNPRQNISISVLYDDFYQISYEKDDVKLVTVNNETIIVHLNPGKPSKLWIGLHVLAGFGAASQGRTVVDIGANDYMMRERNKGIIAGYENASDFVEGFYTVYLEVIRRHQEFSELSK